MILEFTLFIWFIISILSVIGAFMSKTTDKTPISKYARTIFLVMNCIFIITFSIVLYKQLIISEYQSIVNAILIWFIIDCIIGSCEGLKTYNSPHTVITNFSKVYSFISGILGIFGTLFIWL